MKLRNLKATFVLKNRVFIKKKVKNQIFKLDGFTFTVYNHSPYLLNVTGVKQFAQLKVAKAVVESKLHQQVKNIRIDNTFFSQKNFNNVDLSKVYAFMQKNEVFHVDYNVELFAGMYFHPKKDKYPTILFFRTGSYTMMGGKDKKTLTCCENFVNKLIEMFERSAVKV